jgi:hypothetical protein
MRKLASLAARQRAEKSAALIGHKKSSKAFEISDQNQTKLPIA